MRRKIRKLTALVLVGTATLGAHAHGTEQHGADSAPVIKEQTAWGIAGSLEQASRSIEVVMTDDMRMTPGTVTVREGETVHLAVRNAGAILHELVIGDAAALKEHAELMMRFPDMAHDEPYMVHVPPGESADIVWTFNRAGDFEFAFLIAGHFQAGMIATVSVERADMRASLDGQQAGHVAGPAH